MLVDCLPQSEQDLIKQWISAYGISSRDRNDFPHYRMAPLSHILRGWDSAKQQHLWKMFGEQFVLEREVSYQRPEDILHEQIRDSLDNAAMHKFREDLFCAAEKQYNYWSTEHGYLRRLFDITNLTENRYKGRPFELTFDDKTFQVAYDCKLMKILNRLAKHFGLEKSFEDFRIAHSQILNQKLLKGTLCISIHPFDYMTMSDNTYDWDSCMSWENDGCYRTGTVEMMNSPYMVVAYLRGNEPFRVWGNSWAGNKKWRELYVVHPHAICNIKPYPYMNEALSDIVLEWLRELAAHNLNWDVSYDPMHFDTGCLFEYHDKKTYSFSFDTYRMYNDFDTCNTNHKIIIPQQDLEFNEEEDRAWRETIDISGANICVCCGERWWPDEGHEDQVLCPSCDPGPCCSSCGYEDDEDDMYYVEGDYLCTECYYQYANRCRISDEYFYTDNMVKLYMTPVDDNVMHLDLLTYCWIHERYAVPNGVHYESAFPDLDTVHRATVDGETIYYVNMSECAEWCIEDWFELYNARAVAGYVSDYESALSEAED